MKKIIIIIFLIIFIILLFIPLFPRLVINDVKNNKINIILKSRERSFIISYVHSVNKSEVKDCYIIGKYNDIILDKTRFVSYGAGIPEPLNDNEEKIIITDNYIEINNMNRIIKDLYLFVGLTANHTLIIDDKVIELKDKFKTQTNIKIEYKNISVFYYIKSFIMKIIKSKKN